jgi:hypothetical protein
MAEREKYYIGLNGQIFEVSKELYETYYKGQRKEKYFTHDLKQEHTKVDKETGEMIVIPSREDSYERLLEAEKQFAEETEKVEGCGSSGGHAGVIERSLTYTYRRGDSYHSCPVLPGDQ